MDGYVVAPHGTEVELGNGVRHVAQLETGEVFVAFEGDRPCAGALLIAAEERLPAWFHGVRHHGPQGVEAFYIVTAAHFETLTTGILAAATRLSTGNVLVQTNGEEIEGAIWGSVAASYIDERLVAV